MPPFQDALNNGAFTIQQVITALRNDGYIMEGRGPVGSVCGRTLITSIESNFERYCLENHIPVDDNLHLLATATDKGDVEGSFRYIVYNSDRYSLEQATQLLVLVNTTERTIRDMEDQTR
jgi:hypothetical protein